MCNDYIFKEVKPKDGVMKEIHYDVLGRRCYIIALEKGQRGRQMAACWQVHQIPQKL